MTKAILFTSGKVIKNEKAIPVVILVSKKPINKGMEDYE